MPSDSPSMSRRQLLVGAAKLGGGAALLGAGSSLLGAVGAPIAAASAKALATVSYQLSYLENVQFGGSYVADNSGFFRKQGIQVNFIPGGSNTAVEPVVESGKALIGNTHTVELAEAVANGADLKVVGAGYQKNPFCVISRASNPITTPGDVIGKRIGVADANQPLFQAFLKGNRIDPSKVRVVTVQSSPTPLADGQVEGYVGFYTNEAIELELAGVKVHTLLFNDYGLPFVEELYIVRSTSLSNSSQRKLIIEFMRAERRGWQVTLTNPKEAAQLAVSKYGANLKLNLHQQVLEAEAQNTLVAPTPASAKRLFWVSPQQVRETLASLALGGTRVPASVFTDEILREI